ncbi:Elongation of very long chain fatty acids protein 6 [Heterocephalus glaber]|uniref:Elongation of very long chain fatty acids protein n=1 Tax=Heterocephalus glaber TaxID=10181 RepID=G5AQM6_HETGA|nr:Elongation of very long chain fatty acids protein 6 [Heterocephalus glaber]
MSKKRCQRSKPELAQTRNHPGVRSVLAELLQGSAYYRAGPSIATSMAGRAWAQLPLLTRTLVAVNVFDGSVLSFVFAILPSVLVWNRCGKEDHPCGGKKSFLFSALYAAFIFGGRHLMNKRAKFELRKPLVLWSLTLAVFRSLSLARTVRETYSPPCRTRCHPNRKYPGGTRYRFLLAKVRAVHPELIRPALASLSEPSGRQPAAALDSHPSSSEARPELSSSEALDLEYAPSSDQLLLGASSNAHFTSGRGLAHTEPRWEETSLLWSRESGSGCKTGTVPASIFGALRTGAYMVYILMTKGLKQSVCDQGFYIGPVSKFWAYAFVLSKAPELGDTMFIILRKQKLIFLHWYHHITVLLYSWYSYKDMVAGGGWFMTMNYGVHAVMYSYYALRAAGFRVSRKFAMFITLSQITQMLMGCVINYLVFYWMQQDQCYSHFQNIFWSSLMYLSYLVLFCHFFFEAYIGKMRKTAKAE